MAIHTLAVNQELPHVHLTPVVLKQFATWISKDRQYAPVLKVVQEILTVLVVAIHENAKLIMIAAKTEHALATHVGTHVPAYVA